MVTYKVLVMTSTKKEHPGGCQSSIKSDEVVVLVKFEGNSYNEKWSG